MNIYAPYRNDIDGLRALAVLPVLFFHFHVPGFSGGFSGVDVFFVISGFVISRSIQLDIAAGKFTITRFYFKRIRRILPAMLFVIAITTIAAIWLLLPTDLIDYGKSVVASSSFLANMYFWKTSGYFSPEAATRPLLHMWSLSVEEQYYVIAPAAFYLIHRYLRARWKIWLGIPLLASFLFSVAAVFVAPTANFFILPTRAWELLAGAMLFLCVTRGPTSHFGSELVSWLGAALIVISYICLNEEMPFPGWNALLPVLGCVLVVYAGMAPGGLPSFNRMLTWQPLVWIGLISYSLYLVHWPIASLFRYRQMRLPDLTEAAAMITASIAIAAFSWRYVEQPLRHIGFDRTRMVLLSGAVTLAAIGAAGYVLVALSGLPQRMPNFAQRHIAGTEDWGGAKCFNLKADRPISWDQQVCRRASGSNGRVLIWGDSFAAHYMPGIVYAPELIDADVYQYTFAGCPPLLEYYSLARIGCSQSNARVPQIVHESGIDVVVVVARWTDTPQRALTNLPSTIAAIEQAGAQVVVIGQSPQFASDVQKLDYLSGQYVAKEAAWRNSTPDDLNRKIASLAGAERFVDPSSALCQGEICPYRLGSSFLYADYGHFSREGAIRALRLYLAPALLQRLSAELEEN